MVDDPAPTEGDDPVEQLHPESQTSGDDTVIPSPNENSITSEDMTPKDGHPLSAKEKMPNDPASATPKKRVLKIGSQRDDVAKVTTETKRPTSDRTSDSENRPREKERAHTPTVDSVLTPELQKEIALAIGDTEIDQLLTSPVAVANDVLSEGDRIEGRVLSVTEESVVIDLAQPNQGILTSKQCETLPKAGETISVLISHFNVEEGVYELALPGASVSVDNWNELAENMVVEAQVTGHNKGGLEVSVNGLRGFIPASQVALFRVNDLQECVGQKFPCVVTKVEAKRRNLILSRRAVLEREREANKEKMLAALQTGQVCEGIVSKIQPFGAFVDLGGIDGLIHISKISWTRIGHPSEVLKEGATVKVKIDRVDHETGKIGLSYRDTFENPWHSAATRYPIRSRVKGTVTRLTEFGAFVRLEAGIEGLLHVSEIAHHRVQRASDILRKNEEIEVQVLSIDPEAQRISLSLKALQAPPSKQDSATGGDNQKSTALPDTTKKAQKSNLKGGTDRKSGGEQFGLKW